jgi:hypothetical protein
MSSPKPNPNTILKDSKILSISLSNYQIIVQTENHYIEFVQDNERQCCE